MKRGIFSFVRVALLLFVISGCEKADEPIVETNSEFTESALEENYSGTKLQEEGLPDYFVAQLESYESKLINTYNVTFTGRVIKGTGDNVTTTFNYTVSGTNETPQLDSFFLEVPGCSGIPLSWTPQQSSNLMEDVIKWNSSVSKDGSQDYSITFYGEVPLGIITTTVTRGSNIESSKILGPCKGVYTLSGSIFIDADEDGIKDASESGIPSIPVDLFNSSGEKITTGLTTGNGLYSFKVLEGDYQIAVGDDLLNDDNYTAVGNTSVVLENVSEDLSGADLDFGYKVNSTKITQDLENTVILVNTEPTKFWVQQIRNAGKKNAVYSQEQIRGFLITIESLLLTDPFQFGTDKENNALNILTRPIKSDLDLYLQQLLTAELNVVSGRGALKPDGSLNDNFNSALLIYGEAVGCREIGKCSDQTAKAATTSETKAISTDDSRMLTAFNGSGGIN